jgi:hypothetical protein
MHPHPPTPSENEVYAETEEEDEEDWSDELDTEEHVIEQKTFLV